MWAGVKDRGEPVVTESCPPNRAGSPMRCPSEIRLDRWNQAEHREATAAAMIAKLAGHVWSFDELFGVALSGTQAAKL